MLSFNVRKFGKVSILSVMMVASSLSLGLAYASEGGDIDKSKAESSRLNQLRNQLEQFASPGASYAIEVENHIRQSLQGKGLNPEQIERRVDLTLRTMGVRPHPHALTAEKGMVLGLSDYESRFYRSLGRVAIFGSLLLTSKKLNDAEKAGKPEGSPLLDSRAVSDAMAPRKVELPVLNDQPVGLYITVKPVDGAASAASAAASGR